MVVFMRRAMLVLVFAAVLQLLAPFVFDLLPTGVNHGASGGAQAPTVADLEARFGSGRNLTHVETRELYHAVLKWGMYEWLPSIRDEPAPPGAKQPAKPTLRPDAFLAGACVAFRWRARLYARFRDAEPIEFSVFGAFDASIPAALTPYVLGARDVGVHVLSNVMQHVSVWQDAVPCLAQAEGYACPSFRSLMTRHRHDAGKVLLGCFKTNEGFDQRLRRVAKIPHPTAAGEAEIDDE